MLFNRPCREVAHLILAREDRALGWGERLTLRVHLAMCQACPNFERQVLTMRRALRRWRAYAEGAQAEPK